MRNKTLENAARIMEALVDRSLTRAELEREFDETGIELSKDKLTNLLLDLQEMGWIEKRPRAGTDVAEYRIGMTMALYWRRALDAERREIRERCERVEWLGGNGGRNLAQPDPEIERILRAAEVHRNRRSLEQEIAEHAEEEGG